MIADARTIADDATTQSQEAGGRVVICHDGSPATAHLTKGDESRQSGEIGKRSGDDGTQDLMVSLEAVEGCMTKADWRKVRKQLKRLKGDELAEKCLMIQVLTRLTGPKERALAKLMEGGNITQAAAAANVSRQTLSYWLNHDIHFRSALSIARADAWQVRLDAMRALGGEAIATLKGALNDPDTPVGVKVRAALGVLSLLSDAAPQPPQMPGDIEREDDFKESWRLLSEFGFPSERSR